MPGRPYILAETNWTVVEETPYEVAVLPWGAIEAHNYHLPYATDVIESDRIAAAAAQVAWEQEAKVIVLPTVPYGVNTGQVDVKLDINLNRFIERVSGDQANMFQDLPKIQRDKLKLVFAR